MTRRLWLYYLQPGLAHVATGFLVALGASLLAGILAVIFVTTPIAEKVVDEVVEKVDSTTIEVHLNGRIEELLNDIRSELRD